MPDSRTRAERRPALLLVDDDAVMAEALSRAFDARGFDVRLAASVEEANEAVARQAPDYGVVDLRVRDRNGLEIVAAIREANPLARTVVVTAYGNIATAIESIKLGATYYLCKPATADEIIGAFRHEPGVGVPLPREKPLSIKRLEWEHLWRVLREHGGNISQAARALSMHRRTLQRKLAKRPVRN